MIYLDFLIFLLTIILYTVPSYLFMSLPCQQEHDVPYGQLHKASQQLHATTPFTPVAMKANYGDIKQLVEVDVSLHIYI